MKKILLFALTLTIGVAASAQQCDPSAYDWGSEPFGVSPNPAAGENFDEGFINQPYSDQVYVKAPTQLSDIPGAPPLPIALDSLALDSITFFIGSLEQNINELGLTVTCNNNGVSPIECNFYPGGAYCGDITGVPTLAGSFPVKIYATGYFVFGSAQAVPYAFEDYTLIINEETTVVEKVNTPFEMNLIGSNPNPSNDKTNIQFDLTQSSQIQFAVYNLLGEVIDRRTIAGKKGSNSIQLETSQYRNGVYLFSIQAGEKRLTKRLVVQH